MPQQILVLGCYEHTLTVLRSLSRAGHAVILGVTAKHVERGFAHTSRCVSDTWQHPEMLDDPTGFDAALLNYLAQNPAVNCIFPVGEEEIRRIAHLRQQLSNDTVLIMPSNGAVESCLNKSSANQLADVCRVPVPRTQSVHTAFELCVAVQRLGFPVIVKPVDSTNLLHNKKCLFIRNEKDLQTLSNRWPGTKHEFVVQREFSGARRNCDVVAQDGEIKLYFEAEILRTDQLDYAGNSVLDRSVQPNPLHKEYCRRMLKKLNYTGSALFQFLRDPQTGESCFLEVNPRVGAAISLAASCGVDLPAASVNACTGNSPEQTGGYASNQLRYCVHDDLQGLRKARVYREVDSRQSFQWLGRVVRDAARADFFSTLVWHDPKPTLKIYWNLFIRLFLREKRGLVSNNNLHAQTARFVTLQSEPVNDLLGAADSLSKK